MRKTYRYITDKSGNVRAISSDQILIHKPGEDGKSFRERVLAGMYERECEGHDFAKTGYSKSELKRIWRDDKTW
jgi:hypothetical protein